MQTSRFCSLRRFRQITAVLLTLVMPVVLCTAEAGGRKEGADSCRAEVISSVRSFANAHGLAGVAYAAGDEHSILISGSVGNLDPNTTVPVASAAKWPAAAIVMSLVEEGLLDLDKAISDYLQGVPPDAGNMTIRQALSHTAGVAPRAVFLDLGSDGVQASAYRLLGRSLVAAPGSEFNYGGSSYQIVAGVAEAVTRKQWSELSRERLEEPLGIQSFVWGHPLDSAHKGTPQIAGGLYSSTADYATFLVAMAAGGGAMLKRDSVDKMFTDALVDAKRVGVPDVIASRFGYGLGVWCVPAPPKGSRCQQVHSAGAFGTFPTLDVDAGIWSLVVTKANLGEIFVPEIELGGYLRNCVKHLRDGDVN